ncbi:MAG: hypothetical protein Q9217_004495 [Psora testacea]
MSHVKVYKDLYIMYSDDISASQSLCGHCKQINFDALRGPSAIDLRDLAGGKIAGERFAGTGQDKVDLGTLGRIHKDASQCRLCSLFYDLIQRQGASYQRRSVYRTLDSDDIYFRADPDLCYYARIQASGTNSNGSFILRQLSLTAHKVLSPQNTIAYFDNVIQVCGDGILKAPAEASTVQARNTVNGMLFGWS